MSPSSPAYHVLRARSQFLHIQKSALRYVRPHFVCSALTASAPSLSKHFVPDIGFTITKKCGNAVVRNRIRRRMREALRAELLSAPLTMPLQCVFLMRSSAADAPFDVLRTDIGRALSWLQHQARKVQTSPHSAPNTAKDDGNRSAV